jgi:hypothetical protein
MIRKHSNQFMTLSASTPPPTLPTSRLAVAPVGSKVIDESGAEITIQRTAVGGVMSEGMFCDSRMLGWIGGAENIASQMPPSLPIGSTPPATKPRGGGGGSGENSGGSTADGIVQQDVKPLFEKKLTKEEKKKLADEKRKAKKAAKEAAKGNDEGEAE